MKQYETRPGTIVLACAASLAIWLYDVVSTVTDGELLEMPQLLVSMLVLSVIPLVLTVAAFLRRNWGRIALAVMTALGAVSFPALLFFQPDLVADTAVSLVREALYAVAEALVAVCLFLPASNAWYRTARAETA
jgi:hypothetical protein